MKSPLFKFFIHGLPILFVIVTLMASNSPLYAERLSEKVDSIKLPASLKFSGYIDTYYAYYTDSVGQNEIQKFQSISPRSNHFGLNTIQFNVQYDASRVRAQVGIHFGDIANFSWPSSHNNIMEAHAGFKLSKKWWLDAGFFRTHVGTEGLLPKENFTSSVAICTFHEPFLESGLRLQYTPNEKFNLYLYALNGYNIYTDNNKKKSFGVLLNYTQNENLNIGYSNYLGDDGSINDSINKFRIFQNLFLNYQHDRLKIQAGVDYALQSNSQIYSPNKMANMFGGVLSCKFQQTTSFAYYSRAEICRDPDGFLSGSFVDKQNKITGIKTWGITAGIEYKPTSDSYLRLEARNLRMDKDQEIFNWNGKSSNSRWETLANFGISF